MGTSYCFPINGDYLASGQGADGLTPFQEAVSKPLGVQPGEDPAEGIVGGNAVGQPQKSLQSSFLALAK
jgi:hypothetical protein